MVRRILLVAGVAAVIGSTGCRHCCKRLSGRPTAPPPPRDGFLTPPPPPSGGTYIPPPSLPTGPADRRSDPPPAPDTRGGGLPPPTLSDSFRVDAPPAPDRKPPATVPDKPNGSGPRKIDLDPDPLPGGPATRKPADPLLLPPGDPNSTSARFVAPGTVPGVERFAVVADGLASGRKPLVEGFDSLFARGYRTAVYLHPPGADVSAVQDLAERKRLRFVAVPVSPDSLKVSVPKFADAVGVSNRPAVVLDDSGEKAGAMWYLYFRTALGQGDEVARIRATPLGLPDSDEWRRAMDEYLASR